MLGLRFGARYRYTCCQCLVRVLGAVLLAIGSFTAILFLTAMPRLHLPARICVASPFVLSPANTSPHLLIPDLATWGNLNVENPREVLPVVHS